MKALHEKFRKTSSKLAGWLGSVQAFILSVLVVIFWAICGPFFNWSDSHQLIINTFTTVVTFWMVFVIQNTQNRNDKEVQLKLDEIIRSLRKARNSFIDLQNVSDEELKKLEKEIKEICARGPKRPKNRCK